MDAKTISIDWATVLPVLIAALAPTITGFLQQLSKQWIEKAPWYLKGLLTSGLATLIGLIGSYAANGDAMMAAVGGAIIGTIGSFNIAFRKGTRGNLEVTIEQQALALLADPAKRHMLEAKK